jgi:hypothetical protein
MEDPVPLADAPRATSSGSSTLGARERRTVLWGASVVTVSLLVTYVLLPFARHWELREVELEGTRARVTEVAALVANARALDSAATAEERLLASGGRRVIRARSRALAASALQSFLQDASDASRLVVTRLDVATGDTDNEASPGADSLAVDAGTSPATFIPATLSAHCDVTGLADLLSQFSNGPRVVQVERMTVQTTSALRGAPDMLQVTLTLRAPVIIE